MIKMKIVFCAVILCLIATTYSFTLRKTTNGLIRRARDVSSSALRRCNICSTDAAEFDRMLAEVALVVKAKCDMTSGDETAFSHLIDGVPPFVDCVNSTIESLLDDEAMAVIERIYGPKFDEQKFSDLPIESLRQVYQIACPLQKHLFKCLTEFSTFANGCLTAEERETKDILLDVVGGVVDYVCENDGERAISFIENDGVDCINATLIDEDVCRAKMKGIVDDDFSFLQTESSCNAYSEQRSCIIEHIGQCNKPKVTDFVDGLFTVVWSSTSCQKFRTLPEITSNDL